MFTVTLAMCLIGNVHYMIRFLEHPYNNPYSTCGKIEVQIN